MLTGSVMILSFGTLKTLFIGSFTRLFIGSFLPDTLFTTKVGHSFNCRNTNFIIALLGQGSPSTEQWPMKAKFQSVHILIFHHL